MAARHTYKDADGKRLPSVTTIISRFKDSGGLLYWANTAGLNGQSLDEARIPAATVGTIAHDMVEAHRNGREMPAFADQRPELVEKAKSAFGSYTSWTKLVQLEIIHTEVPLVSGVHRFGGRLDAIGIARNISNGLALVDWKTSGSVWSDYLYQMAAYKLLWDENYPETPIEGGFHLCRFAKEEGDFAHHYFPALEKETEAFLKMRELYDVVKKVEARVK